MMTSSEGPLYGLASGLPNPKPTTDHIHAKGTIIRKSCKQSSNIFALNTTENTYIQ